MTAAGLLTPKASHFARIPFNDSRTAAFLDFFLLVAFLSLSLLPLVISRQLRDEGWRRRRGRRLRPQGSGQTEKAREEDEKRERSFFFLLPLLFPFSPLLLPVLIDRPLLLLLLPPPPLVKHCANEPKRRGVHAHTGQKTQMQKKRSSARSLVLPREVGYGGF